MLSFVSPLPASETWMGDEDTRTRDLGFGRSGAQHTGHQHSPSAGSDRGELHKTSNSRGSSDQYRNRCRQTTWTTEEDEMLKSLVEKYGTKSWTFFASDHFNGSRSASQLRSRWVDILCPERTNKPWTWREDQLLLRTYLELGPKWKAISLLIEGRVQNDVKNRFRKLIRDGRRAMIDAVTPFEEEVWIKHCLSTCQPFQSSPEPDTQPRQSAAAEPKVRPLGNQQPIVSAEVPATPERSSGTPKQPSSRRLDDILLLRPRPT